MGNRQMRKKHGTVAVLASGGVDSACLIDWAAARARAVQPIYVSFGLRWERAEKNAMRRFIRAMRQPNVRPAVVLQLPVRDLYESHWGFTGRGIPGRRSRDAAVYIPGRNLLLLSKASVYCAARGIETIAIGTLSANPFRDATPDFFSTFSRLASKALDRPIRVIAPFRRWTKYRLIRAHAHLPLDICFSCLHPAGDKPCGRCNKCEEWMKASKKSSNQ